MRTAESVISDVLMLELDDHELLKVLRKTVISAYREFDKETVNEFLAEMYPFYENSPSELLQAYLLSKYELHHHHNPVSEVIEKTFNENGIVVLSDADGIIKVIHLNTKSHSRNKHPIQVSKWQLSRGVFGDSVHCSLQTAIKDESLTRLKIVKQSELEAIESALVDAETSFQYQFKEQTGQYRLS
ncbi:MAG: hypothetical protein V7749_00255 [Cocleimonas sp.]